MYTSIYYMYVHGHVYVHNTYTQQTHTRIHTHTHTVSHLTSNTFPALSLPLSYWTVSCCPPRPPPDARQDHRQTGQTRLTSCLSHWSCSHYYHWIEAHPSKHLWRRRVHNGCVYMCLCLYTCVCFKHVVSLHYSLYVCTSVFYVIIYDQ